ncbi:hypothetical protein CW304_29415 [Bacillus sp. UFRGS-B20]|nr:hypothetical protein CW304_29415 [Bacillus sp. UFRGS-B20]
MPILASIIKLLYAFLNLSGCFYPLDLNSYHLMISCFLPYALLLYSQSSSILLSLYNIIRIQILINICRG